MAARCIVDKLSDKANITGVRLVWTLDMVQPLMFLFTTVSKSVSHVRFISIKYTVSSISPFLLLPVCDHEKKAPELMISRILLMFGKTSPETSKA